MSLTRQFTAYISVGVFATLAHYGVLIGLVEGAHWPVVPATLCGYVLGGVVAYVFNRRHTFKSVQSHARAGFRFTLVALVGFCVTYTIMVLLVDHWRTPYLLAQIVTSLVAMFLTFTLNRLWTFG
jgi:putative flippase GtrA